MQLWYNHVFAVLISIPRFNSINFYQNRPKIIFGKKIQNFRALGDPLQDPRKSPPLQISDYAPAPIEVPQPHW